MQKKWKTENIAIKDLSRQAASRGTGCRAAGAASEVSVRIFAEKGSDFVQGVEPNCFWVRVMI